MPPRRPTSRVGKAEGPGGAPRSRRAVPASQGKSPLPLILGIAGGAFVLIIIIVVVATSGGSAPPPRERPSTDPIKVNHSMSKENTGRIMFICSPEDKKHEDKEKYIDVCTKCYQTSTFFWNNTYKGYVCFKCSYLFPQEQIKCDECGKVPQRHRIKPRR